MKLRSSLAGTAVLASLLGAGSVIVAPLVKPAYAQTSLSIGVFYDGLADHGDWVSLDNRYVFVPAGVSSDWRPYTVGHWVYADRYGWTWASEEPFGWATFHYGRWGFAEDIGWYWVPGTVWAPAWVSWKRTSDHVVWAPLPVYDDYDYNDSDIRIDVNIDSIPDIYWVAVPSRQFLEVNLEVVLVDDRDRRRTIVREAEPLGTVVIENNVVINNVVNVTYIEEQTGRDVKVVKVRETKDPKEAKATDDEVVAVTEPIRAEKDAKPDEVSDVKEVERRQKDRKSSDAGDQPLGNAVVDEADKPDATGTGEPVDAAGAGENEPGTTLPRKKKQTGELPATDDTSAATEDDASDELQQGANDQQSQKKREKKAGQQQPDTQGVIDEKDKVQEGQSSDQQSGQKVKRKKRKAEQSEPQGVIDEDNGQESQSSDQQDGQKVKRKKRKAEQSEPQGVIDEEDKVQDRLPSDGQAGQKPKRKKRQVEQPATQGVIDQQDVPASQGEAGGAAQPSSSQNESGPPLEPAPAPQAVEPPVEVIQP